MVEVLTYYDACVSYALRMTVCEEYDYAGDTARVCDVMEWYDGVLLSCYFWNSAASSGYWCLN